MSIRLLPRKTETVLPPDSLSLPRANGYPLCGPWLVKAEPEPLPLIHGTPVWLVRVQESSVSDWCRIVGVTRELHTPALMWRTGAKERDYGCSVGCFAFPLLVGESYGRFSIRDRRGVWVWACRQSSTVDGLEKKMYMVGQSA